MAPSGATGKLAARREAVAHRDSIATVEQPKKGGRRLLDKTPEDLAREAKVRKANHREYTDDVQDVRDMISERAKAMVDKYGKRSQLFYEREILQTSRIGKGNRKANAYNAYMRAKLKEVNDALPSGTKKHTSTSAVGLEISAEWASMTEEEKIAAAAGPLADLEQVKELQPKTKHNSVIAAFHDTQTTLEGVQEDLRRLYARTGTACGLVTVRTEQDHLQEPTTFATSDAIDGFFNLAYNSSLDETAMRLESYHLSGVHGVLQNRDQNLHEHQGKVAQMILKKLREITGYKAHKMFYSGFDKITEKWGVIIVNWPLKSLVAPSAIRSITELELLEAAWSSGSCRFRKLSAAEKEAWKAQRNPAASDSEDAAQSPAAAPGLPIHAVTTANGDAVKITQSGPRKRRSDFQGTHQSKKKRAAAADEDTPANPATAAAASGSCSARAEEPDPHPPTESTGCPPAARSLPSPAPMCAALPVASTPRGANPTPPIQNHELMSQSPVLAFQSVAVTSRNPMLMSSRHPSIPDPLLHDTALPALSAPIPDVFSSSQDVRLDYAAFGASNDFNFLQAHGGGGPFSMDGGSLGVGSEFSLPDMDYTGFDFTRNSVLSHADIPASPTDTLTPASMNFTPTFHGSSMPMPPGSENVPPW